MNSLVSSTHYSKMRAREMSCGLLWVSISWHVTPPKRPHKCKADFSSLFHGPFLRSLCFRYNFLSQVRYIDLQDISLLDLFQKAAFKGIRKRQSLTPLINREMLFWHMPFHYKLLQLSIGTVPSYTLWKWSPVIFLSFCCLQIEEREDEHEQL